LKEEYSIFRRHASRLNLGGFYFYRPPKSGIVSFNPGKCLAPFTEIAFMMGEVSFLWALAPIL
jgi:hypothetical protein